MFDMQQEQPQQNVEQSHEDQETPPEASDSQQQSSASNNSSLPVEQSPQQDATTTSSTEQTTTPFQPSEEYNEAPQAPLMASYSSNQLQKVMYAKQNGEEVVEENVQAVFMRVIEILKLPQQDENGQTPGAPLLKTSPAINQAFLHQ